MKVLNQYGQVDTPSATFTHYLLQALCTDTLSVCATHTHSTVIGARGQRPFFCANTYNSPQCTKNIFNIVWEHNRSDAKENFELG